MYKVTIRWKYPSGGIWRYETLVVDLTLEEARQEASYFNRNFDSYRKRYGRFSGKDKGGGQWAWVEDKLGKFIE